MSRHERFVLLDDPYSNPGEGKHVEFRLNYRGALKATQRDPEPDTGVMTKHWPLKHDMRLTFHRQIRKIWKTTPILVQNQTMDSPKSYHIENLANEFQIPPWKFVPLVTERLQVICGIEIILLRLDHPGASVWSGDIDNRVKTIIDALEVPEIKDGYAQLSPGPDDTPLFCLLENDRLLSRVTVETGMLLDAPADADQSYAQATVTVQIRPDHLTFGNMGL